MGVQVSLHFKPLAVKLVVGLLALSSGVLQAQMTVSAGPLPLREVKTVYIAPSSDDFMRLLKSRLETWGAVKVTTLVEEADAILTCETETRVVPAKVVVRVIERPNRQFKRRVDVFCVECSGKESRDESKKRITRAPIRFDTTVVGAGATSAAGGWEPSSCGAAPKDDGDA